MTEKKREIISGGWKNVPADLFTKTELRENGLKPKGEEFAVAEVYLGRQWCLLYKEEDCVPIRKMSEKQKAALEKARAAYQKKCFCADCGSKLKSYETIEEHFADALKDHYNLIIDIIKDDLQDRLCRDCLNEVQEKVYTRIVKLHTKEKLQEVENTDYVVLKIETTGLTSQDEIIQIAIIDKHENVLLHTYIEPTTEVTPDAKWMHGKSNADLVGEPKWTDIYEKVKEIVTGKNVVIFNESFVWKLISGTNERYGLPKLEIEYLCMMAEYLDYFYYYTDRELVSLNEATHKKKTNEALHDCLMIHELFKRILED